jgi:uncharacterized RDD family membrane protein YckC
MPNSAAVSATPTIRRRLTVIVYETFLLAAVLLAATALFMLVTGNAKGALFEHGRKLWLFLVTGAYFVFCWTDSGHTLAMKTWNIKLVTRDGARVPRRTAVIRYVLAWGWFLPAIIVSYAFHLTANKSAFSIALLAGMAAWALTALLDRDRQFLHDRLAGTRLVLLPKLGKTVPVQQGAAS